MKRLLYTLLCISMSAMAFAQGVTTAALNGRVLDEDGEPLIGANVIATHTPSGTVYGNSTDLDGYYRIPNMRIGGPYRIEVSYTGYETIDETGIYLALGQSLQYNATLGAAAIELGAVEIVATRNDVFDGNRTGQESVVDERTINDIPTISRAIGDYARFNPLANIGEGGDGFTISLAGQNNRYNTIYIDGAVNNDAFGLAGSGTNGGQTGVQPISIDAIEQFTIAVAPFDVRQSGFAGGAINAVTRSGTNNFEGSAYYFFRNADLAGKTPTDQDIERTKLSDFTARTFGFRLGGPVIKNKLFFFVNAELQRDETPQPFQFIDYEGNASEQDINTLASSLRNEFGYDVGNFDNNTAFLDSDKFLAKIDWNASAKHKISFRHSYVRAENLEARSSRPRDIRFINGSEYFVSETNSSALEISSVFSNTLSNNLKIGLTIVRDDRDPFGDPFPTVEIGDGDGDILFGAERFSTANLLNQDVLTINNDLSLYKGKHNLLFGVNFEYFNAGNLFIRNNYGRYRYFNDEDWRSGGMTGLERWNAGLPADRYERSFSQVDNVAGDESDAIAEFQQMLLGFYVQDQIQVSEDFKLTAGLRIDIPIWPDDQPENAEFNNTTLRDIESIGYDLQGARTGQFIDPQILFAPRLGFNWDITGDNSNQLRGGIGIFTSRIPLVWPGGAYNNYGFNIGEATASDIAFEPDVQNQPFKADLNDPTPSGQIDLFAQDFKLPQILKANLAFDRKLPGGITASVDLLYSKYINNIRYQNLNLKPSQRTLTGSPDDRPLFEGALAGFGADVVDPTYTYIILASNTDQGYSYNAALTLRKPFDNGFNATVSYSYGDAYTLFDGGSSQNNSQWRDYQNVQGRNFERDAMRSDFAAGHRIFGQFGYEIDYLNFAKTRVGLNLNAQTGGFFSYTVRARNFRFIDDGGFDGEFYWVPRTFEEALLVDIEDGDGNVLVSAEEQWDILDQYISDNDGLNDRRGDYVEKGTGVIPMEFTADFRLLQDFYIEMNNGKRNILQFSVDIFNFTNLLNKDWGRRRFAGSFGNFNIVNLENSVTGSNTVPEYTVNQRIIDGEDPWENNVDDSGFRSSRWQMQLGVRYIFQ